MTHFQNIASQKIVNVWADNLEHEFFRICQIVDKYRNISMDVEFPGIVALPTSDVGRYSYLTVKCNVDLVKPLQLGLSFSDREGKSPTGTSSWQFNFKIDLQEDIYAKDNIEFLTHNGHDFFLLQQNGIDMNDFGELLLSSGIVLNKHINWISYHALYDFGHMLRAVTCRILPETEVAFLNLLRNYFPCVFDLKQLISAVPVLQSENNPASIEKLAQRLRIQRIGTQHQTGSDSLLLNNIFFELVNKFFDYSTLEMEYSHVFWDISRSNVASPSGNHSTGVLAQSRNSTSPLNYPSTSSIIYPSSSSSSCFESMSSKSSVQPRHGLSKLLGHSRSVDNFNENTLPSTTNFTKSLNSTEENNVMSTSPNGVHSSKRRSKRFRLEPDGVLEHFPFSEMQYGNDILKICVNRTLQLLNR